MIKTRSDFSTVIGIIFSFSLVITAIVIGDGRGINFNVIKSFIDIRSILIVIFGTFMITAACFCFRDVLYANFIILKTFLYRVENKKDTILSCLDLAHTYRTKCQTLLDLKNYKAKWNSNRYLKNGVLLLMDNNDFSYVIKKMHLDVNMMNERHKHGIDILRKSAEIAPAMGLIGTLVGLVQMLGQLDDPATIGPAMAIALLTTFYGAILAYMFFMPLSTKLERNTLNETEIALIYIVTLESIAKRENPRTLQDNLNSMVIASARVNYFDDNML
ncbi:MAG: MotA/TolQ/ExbB proton channel family protein [Pseudomonadota bacterium]